MHPGFTQPGSGSASRGTTPRDADPRLPVDTWSPPWASLHAAVFGRMDKDRTFLIELAGVDAARQRREWSVRSWQQEVAAVAATLQSRGVVPGDHVACLAGNSAEALACAFACWSLGAGYAPLDPHGDEARHLRAIAPLGVRVVAHTERWQSQAIALAAEVGAASCPLDHSLADGDSLRAPATSWDDPALILHSGGTTGHPKSVHLSARNLVVNIDAMVTAFGWSPDTRTMCVLPLHHGNGLIINSVVPWFAGGSVVLRDRFRVSTFWRDVGAEGATTASVVPTILEYLSTGSAATGTHPLHEVISGSGPLSASTATRFEDQFGVPVRQLYGLSETTAVVTVTPRADSATRRRWHTQARTPSAGVVVPHSDVAVLSADGARCGPGEEGEVVARGAMIMQGYGDPKLTAGAFDGEWFRTGDRGVWLVDDLGRNHLHITGRTKEIIVRGGLNVMPHETDIALLSHPAVRAAATVGFPSRWYGEEIAAVVVLDQPAAESELIDYCVAIVGQANAPKVILVRDHIPRTATGKLQRLSLAEQVRPDLAAYYNERFPGQRGAR